MGCVGRYLVLRGERKEEMGENYVKKSFMICPPHQIRVHYCQGDQAKAPATDATCGTYWREEKCLSGFRLGKVTERNHFKDLEVDSRIILKYTLK
jgi:hypothetical protein